MVRLNRNPVAHLQGQWQVDEKGQGLAICKSSLGAGVSSPCLQAAGEVAEDRAGCQGKGGSPVLGE